MTRQDNGHQDAGDAVEALLRQAPPRATPPANDERIVRDAVMAEWQSVVRARKWRSRGIGLAAAASVLFAVSMQISVWPPAGVDTIDVASIDKHTGTVHLVDGRSEIAEIAATATLGPGQVVETRADSALGLEWGAGGSLRLDEETRLEFVDEKTVFLHRGRVYFDSLPFGARVRAGDEPRLVVETSQGTVTHIGTQYMASIDGDELIVSVREGRVKIDGRHYDETAGRGKQVQMHGSMRPVVVALSPSSNAWAWTEALSPRIDLSRLSARDFLSWVGRETGHVIVYESDEAERLAADTELVGSMQAEPRTELRLRMMTMDLDYLIDASTGTIAVRIATQDER